MATDRIYQQINGSFYPTLTLKIQTLTKILLLAKFYKISLDGCRPGYKLE